MRILILFFFFVCLNGVAQISSGILVLIPDTNSIFLNNRCTRIISNSSESETEFKKYICSTLKKSVKRRYEADYIGSDVSELNNLNGEYDYDTKRVNSFQRKNKLSGKNIFRCIFSINNERAFVSKKFDDLSELKLKTFAQTHLVKYIVSINLLETIIPRPFDRNTHFNIHVEIYDTDFNILYADVLSEKVRIGKQVYFSTLKYFFKSRIDWIFSQGLPIFNYPITKTFEGITVP